MKKENILFAATGIFIGLFVGFYTANSLNRRENSQQKVSQTSPPNAPFQNQQTQAVDIKEAQAKGAMIPAVAETLDKAENEPDDFDAQTKAGDMYAKIERFDQAAAFYEKAAQIKPDNFQAQVKTGNAYFDSKQFEKAEKFYVKALSKKPDDANVRTDLGITFVEREKPDLDRAVKEFQTVLQANQKFEPALYNLGIAYFKKGDAAQAEKIAAQLEETNPQSQLAQKLRQTIQK